MPDPVRLSEYSRHPVSRKTKGVKQPPEYSPGLSFAAARKEKGGALSRERRPLPNGSLEFGRYAFGGVACGGVGSSLGGAGVGSGVAVGGVAGISAGASVGAGAAWFTDGLTGGGVVPGFSAE